MKESNLLYEKYNSFVRKTSLHMHKRFYWSFDPEEIIQIGWERFMKAYKNFKGDEETELVKFYKYMRFKIQNGIIDEVRAKNGRYEKIQRVKRCEFIEDNLTQCDHVLQEDFKYPKDISFKSIINNLDKKQRNVLSLYYIWDKNQREIGETLNITESGVCLLRKKALKELKKDESLLVLYNEGDCYV